MRDETVEIAGEAEIHPEIHPETVDAVVHPGSEVREKPDGAQDPLGEAGWYIEQERLARGLTLDDAGDSTGIHPYYLEAVELGDMACMPERADALAMIGAYAEFLGFDPEPLVEHFAAHLPAPPAAGPVAQPAAPRPRAGVKVMALARLARFASFRIRGVPGRAGGLVASLAAAVLLFGGASYIMLPKGDVAPAAEQAADAPSPSAADPMPTASTDPDTSDVAVSDVPAPGTDQQAAAGGAQAGQDDLAGTGLNGISSLLQQNPAAPAAAEGVASADDVAVTGDGREFGAGNGASRITLKAKAPVWVRIEDSHGNVVMTQMLMKGDTYRVPDREGLVVIARDGGLLSYMIDGKEKGILGTPGEILVGRSLDLKTFEG